MRAAFSISLLLFQPARVSCRLLYRFGVLKQCQTKKGGEKIFHAVSNLLIVMMQKAPGQLVASAPLSVLGSAPAGTS